ncbi:MAG: GAF domain-containing protein [Gemmatimonadaceae bacterium]|nr:GAF domain-containing protein [Gloeobacterales cyanobacterium ES-bin-141]
MKWQDEPKQRVNLALTSTAWEALDRSAAQQGTSRSELVERYARELGAGAPDVQPRQRSYRHQGEERILEPTLQATLLAEREARSQAEEALRRSEVAARLLAEVSTVLASSLLDYEAALEQVARLAVPDLADWCAIDLLDEDSSIRRVAVVHVDPVKIALGWELVRRYPLSLDDTAGVIPLVLRTGQVEMGAVPDALLASAARDAEHLAILRQLGLKSYLVVPLVARGRLLGAISLFSAESGRYYTLQDRTFAEDFAHRAALAWDNARLYQEAQAASRMKDEFLATLSHELRTPLNPIIGFSQLLRRGKISGVAAERALEAIERNSRLQAHLVDDILDISCVMQGKLKVELCALELHPIVVAVVKVMQPAAQVRAIQIETLLDATRGPVLGDPMRLQQVVWNLLSNAIKFTPPGGRVEVRLTEPVPGHVQLSVHDTGQGISASFLPHVFERFRQADSTPTRQHGGLGLGLAIVHHIVELHGGTIRVDSPGPGQGSTFTVQLPLADGLIDVTLPRSSDSDTTAASEEIQVLEVEEGSPLDGRTLAEANLRRRYGVLVQALQRNGRFIGFPDADFPLQVGDYLHVSGRVEDVEHVRCLLIGPGEG